MKTDQHTVTLPLSDYNELLAAQSQSNAQFEELKRNLVGRIRALQARGFSMSHSGEFLSEVIKQIQYSK